MCLTDKLILGTVQLGKSYGINNQKGKPSRQEAFEILDFARVNGIGTLDTASGYGDAESIIGEYHQSGNHFKVITKFALGEGFDMVKEWRRMCEVLSVPALECLMYHRFNEIQDVAVRNSLLKLRENGSIRKIGVSVYNNVELKEAIATEWVNVVQMPFNLLDNMSHRGSFLKAAKENGKEIHARSVFLQGLFFMDLNCLPNKLVPLKPYLELLRKTSEDKKCSLAALALQYLIRNPCIDKVLIGVESEAQLKQNIEVLLEKINEQVFEDIDALHVEEISLLSPANW